MTTYLHADFLELVRRLKDAGFKEVTPLGTTTMATFRASLREVVFVEVPQTDIYQSIEVIFNFSPSMALLEELRFPM